MEILGGTILMGTDLLRSMGHEGASEVSPFQKMFRGDYWGSLLDRYGIRWMVNVPDPEQSPAAH